jgi:hypothetical protein
MNFINTIAPIAIQDLKKYFTDKTVFYVIDYANSTLKGSKLLVYLSNLDLPCDIDIDTTTTEFKELMVAYFHHPLIVNVPLLEQTAVQILCENKGLGEFGYADFIKDNQEIVSKWEKVLDSLTLYNMYIVNVPEFKQFVESHPIDETSSLEGVNFVSLLKHEQFYVFYQKIKQENLTFYKNYFEANIFKGLNLYSYWANSANPMFLLTFGLAEGIVSSEEYIEARNNTIKEIQNVSSS